MRNEESIVHIVRDYHAITNLLLTYEIYTLLIQHLSRETKKTHIFISTGLILGNKGMHAVKQKRERKSSKRAQLWIANPHFPKIRALRTLHF